MLHIFSVEKGDMLNFDMDYAFKSILELKNFIAQTQNIPAEMQVMLISGGEALNPACTVSSYGAGTETNPVFLFNKLLHEPPGGSSPEPQRQSSNPHVDRFDMQLRQRLDDFKLQEASINTLKTRCAFAQELLQRSADEVNLCRQKIREQHMQQQAWCAALANLEDAVSFFNTKCSAFCVKYQDFLNKQGQFTAILEAFSEDSKTLAKVPLLDKLIAPAGQRGSATSLQDSPATLLDYILLMDPQNSLENLAQNCLRDIQKINPKAISDLQDDINAVSARVSGSTFKQIKGLEERFSGLEGLMVKAESIHNEQENICKQLNVLYVKASNLKDSERPQVVPELCSSNHIQLGQLYEKYQQLKDIAGRCAKSKQELSSNLKVRLCMIGRAENHISDLTSKISIYNKQTQIILRNMMKIEQIHKAPEVYARCIAEVVRRKQFSTLFIKWAGSLSAHCKEVYKQELEHRKNYNAQIRSHFLNRLFPGLDDMPPPFATKNPKPFDDRLPPVELSDVEAFRKVVPPELANLLETSTTLPSLSLMDVDSHSSSDISKKSDTASHQEVRMFEIPVAGSPTDPGYITDNNSNNVTMEVTATETKMCIDNEEREKIRQCVAGIRQCLGAFACDTNVLAQEVSVWTGKIVEDAGRVSDALMSVFEEVHSKQCALTMELEVEQHKREDAQREIVNYYEQMGVMKELLDNAKQERLLETETLKSEITKLQMEHVLELEKLEKKNGEEFQNLENQLADSQAEIRLLRREHEEQQAKMQQMQDEFEKRLNEMSDEYHKRELSVREELERQHKSEIESMRCRYRLISDSGTSPPAPPTASPDIEARYKQRELELRERIASLENMLRDRDEPSNVVSPMEMDNALVTSMGQSMLESQYRVMSESASAGLMDASTLRLPSPNANSEAVAAELREQLRVKEMELQKLQIQLVSTCGDGAVPVLSCDRVSILSCSKGDLVLLTFDDAHENYVIFMLGPVLHFLHKDSLDIMNLSTDRERSTRRWVIGQVVDKEYCEARRASNRYRLPIGTRFFRVKVVPWDRQGAMKREQERRQILKAASSTAAGSSGLSQQQSQGVSSPVSSPATSI